MVNFEPIISGIRNAVEAVTLSPEQRVSKNIQDIAVVCDSKLDLAGQLYIRPEETDIYLGYMRKHLSNMFANSRNRMDPDQEIYENVAKKYGKNFEQILHQALEEKHIPQGRLDFIDRATRRISAHILDDDDHQTIERRLTALSAKLAWESLENLAANNLRPVGKSVTGRYLNSDFWGKFMGK